ncbi:MAG: site-specific integrase [Proteobacteria bacterium]|nr:MAG: site-specific integrase [Pseudomonadota bacterium]
MAIKSQVIDGKRQYEVVVKVRDKAGKQVSRRKRWFDSEREARKVEVELLIDLQGIKSKVTWERWSAHVLEKIRCEYRNSTYFNYKNAFERWFNPPWRLMFVDEIKPSDVHKVIFEDAANLSGQTKKALLKHVKRGFNIAIEEGLLNRNPAVGIRIRCMDANQAILNKNEISVLLEKARAADHRFFPHWSLALLTGMRSGELYSLRWTDIDFVTGKISINKAWTSRNGEGATKSAKARVCPLSNECRKFLMELKIEPSSNPEYVLPRLWEWDQGAQATHLRDFCREIGITEVKFHDLRATFITQMLNNGVALSKVMAIVGHSSLKTTQGYLRLSGKDIEGATEELGITVPSRETADNVFQIRSK